MVQKKNRIISNKAYWIAKIESNIDRDKKVTQLLMNDGWQVLRFWEHEIEKNLEEVSDKYNELEKQMISLKRYMKMVGKDMPTLVLENQD